MESKLFEWNESYRRGENNIRYPQTEVVRFFFRKMRDFCNPAVLDFGCGIGTHTNFFAENGCIATGIDISDVALQKARQVYGRRPNVKFDLIENLDQKLIYEENSFDFSLAESCLDSMPFEFAERYLSELIRVTKKGIFFSLISSKVSSFVGEQTVVTLHERGTIQAYYDLELIRKLIGNFEHQGFEISEIVISDARTNNISDARYYCFLQLS